MAPEVLRCEPFAEPAVSLVGGLIFKLKSTSRDHTWLIETFPEPTLQTFKSLEHTSVRMGDPGAGEWGSDGYIARPVLVSGLGRVAGHGVCFKTPETLS